jgi:hypothetical protein
MDVALSVAEAGLIAATPYGPGVTVAVFAVSAILSGYFFLTRDD